MLVTNKENQKDTNDVAKNTLQERLVTDKGTQKDTNDEEDKVQEEAQVDKTRQDILLAKNENQKQVNDDRAVLPWNSNLPPTQMDPESVTKPKRKRKHANKKLLDAIKEYEGKQDDFKTYSCDHELCLQDGYEKGAKPKLNRKGWVDKKILDTDICSHNNSIKEEEGKQDVYKPDSLKHVMSLQEE